MLYGVVALVGFLSQIVIGMEHRILPLFEWYTRFKASGFGHQPPPPHTMGAQSLRAAVFALWTMGVPMVAVGMSIESAAGGSCLPRSHSTRSTLFEYCVLPRRR